MATAHHKLVIPMQGGRVFDLLNSLIIRERKGDYGPLLSHSQRKKKESKTIMDRNVKINILSVAWDGETLGC